MSKKRENFNRSTGGKTRLVERRAKPEKRFTESLHKAVDDAYRRFMAKRDLSINKFNP